MFTPASLLKLSALALLSLSLAIDVTALPIPTYRIPGQPGNNNALISRQRSGQNRTGGNGNVAAAGVATDGTPIIDDSVVINGLTMRFKISAPASELVANAGAGSGTLGLNVLLHGDGGQSFVDFPNQGVNGNLMGVALLAPDVNRRWGGTGNGVERPDGAEHAAAINELLTTVLPGLVNFDPSQVFLQGVSGGSLLISGFLMPTFGASLAVPGVVLGCGALAPQVAVQGDISGTRIHFQSTVNELDILKQSIPEAILAYEQIAIDAGLNTAAINALQTADASPNGGHCEFDEADFVAGVQLVADNYDAFLDGSATLNGVAVASTGVVGNEQLFGNAAVAVGGNGAAAVGGNGAATVGGGNNVGVAGSKSRNSN